MPSSFPGMDPYLEGNEWGSFHIELSVEIRRYLTRQLGAKYLVRTMKRFVAGEQQDTYPDTAVFKETAAVWAAALLQKAGFEQTA